MSGFSHTPPTTQPPFVVTTTYSVYFRDTTGERAGGRWRCFSSGSMEVDEAARDAEECMEGRPWAETRIARVTQTQEWLDA